MTSNEFDRGEAYASQQDLGGVFAATQAWLEQNRTVRLGSPDDQVYGLHDGLPIVDEAPRIELEIPGTLLHKVVPAAAAKLEVGEMINVSYSLPCTLLEKSVKLQVEALIYSPPEVSFYIEKSAEALIDHESLYIDSVGAEGSPVWESDRVRGDDPMFRGATPEQRLLGFLASMRMDDVLGTNALTLSECAALQEIVDHLDEIAALLPPGGIATP